MRTERDDFDECQDWVDSFAAQSWADSDLPACEPPADLATQVDLVAGEFFRTTWRRRLAAAQGDCGYVARQMRKAGVPLDLALAILLTPDPQLALGAEFDLDDEPPSADAGRFAVGHASRGIAAHAA